MVPALATKDNAKIAWDTLKEMRVGDSRVHEARRQKLRKEFDALAFKKGAMGVVAAARAGNRRAAPEGPLPHEPAPRADRWSPRSRSLEQAAAEGAFVAAIGKSTPEGAAA
jgi:hypothetical protein